MLDNSEKDSNDEGKTVISKDGSPEDEAGDKQSAKSCCLTVTRIPEVVFTDEQTKKLFEKIFAEYGEISVIYLKSFSRARVSYKNDAAACLAKNSLHGCLFQENQLQVYFTQVPHLPQVFHSPTLQPPPPVKQFLISPPASPPVGWEPIPEGTPVINHDLIAAVAQLEPEEPYEAHPPSQAHPSIKVHWCPDGESGKDHPLRNLPAHMVQTRKPHTEPYE